MCVVGVRVDCFACICISDNCLHQLYQTMLVQISSAVKAFELLNGVFAVYKPKLVAYKRLRLMLLEKLSSNLNEMEPRPISRRVMICDKSNADQEDYEIQVHPNYADHPLVVGPRYQVKNFSMNICNYIGYDVSGLVLVGIGGTGSWLINRIRGQQLMKEYEIECVLGFATDTMMDTGKVLEKSTYSHLNTHKIDLVLDKIQTTQQKTIYQGIDLKSQAAYELALKGSLKPTKNNKLVAIYSLKCVKFDPPNFTIRVVTLNENNIYLKQMVHGIGLSLKSNACVSRIRCIKYGPFNALDHALLTKHWDVEHVIKSIQELKPLVQQAAKITTK